METKSIVKVALSLLGVFALYSIAKAAKKNKTTQQNSGGIGTGLESNSGSETPTVIEKDFEVVKNLNNGKPAILINRGEDVFLTATVLSANPVEFKWKLDGAPLKTESSVTGTGKKLTYKATATISNAKPNSKVTCEAISNGQSYECGSATIFVLPKTQNWINWDKSVIDLSFGKFKKTPNGEMFILPKGFGFSVANKQGKNFVFELTEDIVAPTEEKVIVALINQLQDNEISELYTVSEVGRDMANENYTLRFIAKNSGADYNFTSSSTKSANERDAIFNKQFDIAESAEKLSANAIMYKE